MAWICGKHKPTVIADGEVCAACNPPYDIKDADGKITTVKPGTRGKGWTAAEVAEQAIEWAKAQAVVL